MFVMTLTHTIVGILNFVSNYSCIFGILHFVPIVIDVSYCNTLLFDQLLFMHLAVDSCEVVSGHRGRREGHPVVEVESALLQGGHRGGGRGTQL